MRKEDTVTNKGFSILGDSISTLGGSNPSDWRTHYEGEVHVDGVTTQSDTWWGKVIEHFGGHLVSNASYSGSVVEGFGFPGGNSDKRINRLLGDDGTQPDVVLVFMGINDYGWGGGRNQVMGRSASASAKPEDLGEPYEVTSIADENTLARFKAAYLETLQKIKHIAPESETWCVNLAPGSVPGAPWPNFAYRIRGIELDDYNRAIREAADEAGAHVADIRSFNINYSSIEGVHPDALGMKQIAAMVIAQMENGGSNPKDYPILADAEPAQRDCYAPNCDGCPYIDIEPHHWNLYCSKNDPR